MAEAHSHIGASSAWRWLNCPGSVRLYKQLTERKATEYASAGTAAHELCEKCLLSGKDPSDYIGETIAADGVDFEVTDDMVSSVRVYVDEVRRDYILYGGTLNVEKSFSLDWVYPGMFGRNDSSLVPSKPFDTMFIYDYKNGRKAVSAEDNPQLKYYALGALGRHNPALVDKVICKIIQPNSWGKEPVEVWETSAEELYDWAYDVLRPAAIRTEGPDAPCKGGEWCCFCEAAGICPLRRKEALDLLGPAEGTAIATLPAVEQMTADDIAKASAFFGSDPFKAWVKSLQAMEMNLLQRGVRVPGRKLVETTVRGNRRWVSEDAVISALRETCGDEMFCNSLKSPAQIEKLLTSLGISKKDREGMLGDLITRDESTKTIVVSEADNRESLAGSREESLAML